MRARVAGAAAMLMIVAALIAAPLWLKPYGIYIISLWAVTTIAAIGLNLTLGYAGQVSLAQGAFVGIGAYAAAKLSATPSSSPPTIAPRTWLKPPTIAAMNAAMPRYSPLENLAR